MGSLRHDWHCDHVSLSSLAPELELSLGQVRASAAGRQSLRPMSSSTSTAPSSPSPPSAPSDASYSYRVGVKASLLMATLLWATARPPPPYPASPCSSPCQSGCAWRGSGHWISFPLSTVPSSSPWISPSCPIRISSSSPTLPSPPCQSLISSLLPPACPL